MKSIVKLSLCATAVVLLMAPTAVERAHPVFINGMLLGNAVAVNGQLAIPLADFQKAVGAENVRVQGNTLQLVPAITSPRDAATGQASGKRMHKPFVITKELDKASPLLYDHAAAYVPLSDIARFFGVTTFRAPATLPQGAPIMLNFAKGPGARIAATP